MPVSTLTSTEPIAPPVSSGKDHLPELTEELVAAYTSGTDGQCLHHLDRKPLPSREMVFDILTDLFDVLFPGFGRRQNLHLRNIEYYIGDLLDSLQDKLTQQIRASPAARSSAGRTDRGLRGGGPEKAVALVKRLPSLRRVLEKDVAAAFEGDPSARSRQEVVFCFPGLEAVAIYRVAHELHQLSVPLIPRMMTEAAHSKTGIDIHPGAKIGPGFFIDHGTGVVIGETCEIGQHVRLYQGVTLGAVSFPRDAQGSIIRGKKRHPTLENDVVVYANATILGGDTVVGHHSAIGSSVWLTHSVEPYTIVTMEKPQLRIRSKEEQGWGGNYQI